MVIWGSSPILGNPQIQVSFVTGTDGCTIANNVSTDICLLHHAHELTCILPVSFDQGIPKIEKIFPKIRIPQS